MSKFPLNILQGTSASLIVQGELNGMLCYFLQLNFESHVFLTFQLNEICHTCMNNAGNFYRITSICEAEADRK